SQVDSRQITLRSGEFDLSSFDALLIRSMPPGSLEQVVFRMNALAQLASAGVQIVNWPRAIEIAVDKYLATVRLQQAELLVPPTIACQTVDQAMEAFERLGRDVVLKPIFGSEGRGMTRATDEAIALRTCKALVQIEAVLYLQQFVPHEGYDIRLLVIGERVLGMRRRHPNDWRTNISRGAVAEPLEITAKLEETALRAAQAVGASIAGVDLLPGKDGKLYAIEVNAVPGWRALAKVTGTDVAREILLFLGAQHTK
ncbi:MAG: RimK family alpha-L-glutamate ligase, partial [Pirellulales bacterium]|nr:RimK family alpha-L-glutamate ligase [Pirellulales bacterium]